MAQQKLYMSLPGCETCNCPHYVNNCNSATYLKSAKGRTLYWGERYCLHGKRARQFHKIVGALPSWCPRRIRHPIIRIYTKTKESYFHKAFNIQYIRPESKDYTLCRITNTTITPLQFCNKLRNRNTDLYELLAWNPKPYDVIEIDVGLRQFYIWLSDDGWMQTSAFDSEKAERGQIGEFTLIPHQQLYQDRYDPDSCTFYDFGLGFITGYFSGGVFRSNWTDNPAKNCSNTCQKELEKLLYTMQTEGLLNSLEALQSYCWEHWWARMDTSFQLQSAAQYGFCVTNATREYYIVLVPEEYASWNIRIFAY